MFVKYQHVERFGTDEVGGIEFGTIHVFPKIDGTNGSLWLEDGEVRGGSRNREVSLDNDNQGFFVSLKEDERIIKYLEKHPDHRLYGEWLVPHSLKTYREDAWRKFYIFDVCKDTEDGLIYLPYELYTPLLEEHGLDYIPLLCTIKNGSYEQLVNQLEKNTFLIIDGEGSGEGVVLKNYSYQNKYGRTTWAKIVRAEFKEVHSKTMGAPELNGKKMVEETITEKWCTEALIEKEYAKIAEEGWKSEYIPRLFGVVYHDIVLNEMWNIVKQLKHPTINFKTLNHFIIEKIKRVKSEMF